MKFVHYSIISPTLTIQTILNGFLRYLNGKYQTIKKRTVTVRRKG
nr:MAG TPA_asm: hypothetical protein [Caudoviricetes sp.]